MKVQELVEFISNPKNKVLKADQLQIVLKKELEIKEYISIKEKKQLVKNIIDTCILYEDGVYKFDDTDKYICFIMKTIEAYTNIELSEDIEDDYDILCRAKILEIVIDTFKKEYEEVNVLLQMKCDYILSGNNIESQVGRFLDTLMNAVNNIVNVISEKIDNFDMSEPPIDKDDLSKLMSFINIQK
jgi:hypothetical protein